MRDHAREEHVNWCYAMKLLEQGINSTRQNGDLVSINAIPRDTFSLIEDALRDWAVSYARIG